MAYSTLPTARQRNTLLLHIQLVPCKQTSSSTPNHSIFSRLKNLDCIQQQECPNLFSFPYLDVPKWYCAILARVAFFTKLSPYPYLLHTETQLDCMKLRNFSWFLCPYSHRSLHSVPTPYTATVLSATKMCP